MIYSHDITSQKGPAIFGKHKDRPLSVRLPTANIITKVAFCEVLFSSLANDNNFVISTNKYQYFVNSNKMEIRNTNNPQPIRPEL